MDMRLVPDLEVEHSGDEWLNYGELSMSRIYGEISSSGIRVPGRKGGARVNGYCLKHIEEFVSEILNSSDSGYDFETDIFGARATLTKLGEKYVERVDAFIDNYEPNLEYSEYVTLFYRICEELGLHNRAFSFKGSYPFPGLEKEQLLNRLISEIRRIGTSDDFKDGVRRRKQNSRRNYISLVEYVNQLFGRYSRMLVLRLDFYYPNNGIDDVNGIEAGKLRQKFLNNTRGNTLFKEMVGYIWKLELGVSRGLHLHFAFFYDGSRVRKDAFLGERIGMYWKNRITDGNGSFHNCNLRKSEYRNLGIGMVSHDDSAKREELLNVLGYLTKTEQYLKFKTKVRVKVFGKGGLGPGKSSRGRPRKG